MFNFILAILRVIFLVFSPKRMDIVMSNAILKKENEILTQLQKGQQTPSKYPSLLCCWY
jgi:hypothetical protein